MPRIELTGGFYEDSALQFDAQVCRNVFPEYINNGNGKSPSKLKSRQGLRNAGAIQTSSDSTVFKAYTTSSKRSFVALWRSFASENLRIYETFESGTSYTEYSATGDSSPEKIEMIDNGVVISILVTYTSSSDVYFFNLNTNTLTRCTDADLPTYIISQTYKDTYFLYADKLNSRMYVSDNIASDPTSFINALDFTTIESDPDEIEGLEVSGNEVVVFGARTIEFYYNSGNVDFPFERNSGVTTRMGLLSRRSLCNISDALYFVGTNYQGEYSVYSMDNYSVKRIATIPIDFKIAGGSTPATSVDPRKTIGFSYREKGHEFYCLNNFDIGETLVYDISTGVWHTRTANGTNLPIVDVNFINNFNNGTNMFWGNDFNDNHDLFSPFYYDYSLFVEGSDFLYFGNTSSTKVNIDRVRTLPHLTSENKNIRYKSFELDLQKGVGNVDDPNPEIYLYISRDGGMTYGNAITMSMGAKGNYKLRAIAQMLGIGRDLVFKIESDSPVQQEWFTAYIDYEVLNA